MVKTCQASSRYTVEVTEVSWAMRKEKGLAMMARPETGVEPNQAGPKQTIITAGNGMRNRIAAENRRNQQGKVLVIQVPDPDHATRNTELGHRSDPSDISESCDIHCLPSFKGPFE